mmetsp:Transcript_23300/g.35772  ORF Transcript_23300/g.35772 Transcript_23300/m.35772 type:complete len:132 (-) Transcript_23300:232-627(-)
MDLPKSNHIKDFFFGLLVPFVPLQRFLNKAYPENATYNLFTTACYTICYVAWVVLFILVSASTAFRAWGWIAYFANAVILTNVRTSFREKYNLRGDILGDFFASAFFYPQVYVQLLEQADILGLPESGHEE